MTETRKPSWPYASLLAPLPQQSKPPKPLTAAGTTQGRISADDPERENDDPLMPAAVSPDPGQVSADGFDHPGSEPGDDDAGEGQALRFVLVPDDVGVGQVQDYAPSATDASMSVLSCGQADLDDATSACRVADVCAQQVPGPITGTVTAVAELGGGTVLFVDCPDAVALHDALVTDGQMPDADATQEYVPHVPVTGEVADDVVGLTLNFVALAVWWGLDHDSYVYPLTTAPETGEGEVDVSTLAERSDDRVDVDLHDVVAKLSHQSVQYRHATDPQVRCGTCVHLVSLGSCELVADPIYPDGVCERFEARSAGLVTDRVRDAGRVVTDRVPPKPLEGPMSDTMPAPTEPVTVPRGPNVSGDNRPVRNRKPTRPVAAATPGRVAPSAPSTGAVPTSTVGAETLAWHVERDNEGCGGFAVVQDASGELVGCHDTEEGATEELRALYSGTDDAGSDAGTNLAALGMGSCPNCGAAVDQHAATCPQCGTPLATGYANADPLEGEDSGAVTSFAERAAAGDFDWEAVVVEEGVATGDRRFIAENALSWRDLPLPMMMLTETSEHHMGAKLAGSTWDMERVGNKIVARGFFSSRPEGQECRDLISEGSLRGVSVDIDMVSADLTISDDDLEPMMVMSQGRIMGHTVCPFPAMQEASIHLYDRDAVALTASGYGPEIAYLVRVEGNVDWTLDPVASPIVADGTVRQTVRVAPVQPPASWFDRPRFEELTPVVVTAEGQVYGHPVNWQSCHIGYQDRCVTAPRSNCQYAHFYTGHVLTEEGEQVRTGVVYMDCDHADLSLSDVQARDAMAHTGTAVADVRLYEDRFGIAMAGAVRPSATPEMVRAFRGSDISPDWRPINRKRELVGLVCVNTSGFILGTPVRDLALVASGRSTGCVVPADGVPRLRMVADEEETAMVAVGIVRHDVDRVTRLEQQLAAVHEFLRPIRAERTMAHIVAISETL